MPKSSIESEALHSPSKDLLEESQFPPGVKRRFHGMHAIACAQMRGYVPSGWLPRRSCSYGKTKNFILRNNNNKSGI